MLSCKKAFLGILACSFLAAGAAFAQTVQIVSGDGQITPQNFQTPDPLIVVVKNSAGQPLANVAVTWTVSGQGIIFQPTTFTDANGQATNTFLGPSLFGSSFFVQSIVTATAATGGSVSFTVTTSGSDIATGAPNIQVQLLAPVLGDVVTGSGGSVGVTPIQVRVFSGGQPVPNVSVRLIPDDPNGPLVSCSGSSGITDASGTANCLPFFAGKTGTGRFTVAVGGQFRLFPGLNLNVTTGQLALFRVIGGDNQSGPPGTPLATPLVAQLEDAAGNKLAGIPVIWEVLTPGGAALSNVVSQSDSTGRVSALVTLGLTPGAVQVRVKNTTGTIQAVFNLQVTLVVTGLTKQSGDGQDAVINTDFSQPLVVLVSTDRGPVAGVQVQFVAAGSATIAISPVLTDAQGRASAIVHATGNPGTATVTATAGAFSQVFNLTVRLPGPVINTSSFFNAVGGQPGGVSPGSLVSINGLGLAQGLQGCVSGNLVVGLVPFLLSNVSAQFGSSFAPILAVCNQGAGQEFIVAQVPSDLPLGSTTVTVKVGSGSTTVANVPVVAASPGIVESVMSDGRKRAVLLHADGNFVSLQNPAARGERLRAFVTGLGAPVTPGGLRVGTDQAGPATNDARSPYGLVVGVNNNGVDSPTAVYSPDLVGVYIVSFDVPLTTPSGIVNFAVAAVVNDNLVFGNGSSIPIL